MVNKVLFHTLEPFKDDRSKVLILGSFPSVVSRRDGFYYAHPSNRFWKVLAAIYGEEIIDKRAFCHLHHIALWDVVGSCTIHGSSDASIEHVVCNDINAFIKDTDIAHIFTTGGKAASLYKKYIKCAIPVNHLPSTSSANAGMRLEQLIEFYRIVKEYTDEKD